MHSLLEANLVVGSEVIQLLVVEHRHPLPPSALVKLSYLVQRAKLRVAMVKRTALR